MNEKHKKLYYVTRGLKQAEVIEKGTLTSAERVPEGEVFENDYVRIITYKKYDVKEAWYIKKVSGTNIYSIDLPEMDRFPPNPA